MAYIFLAITLVFIAALTARKITQKAFCAICAGVALTWIGLLALYRTGRYHDAVLLGLLMGQSIVGIFYWAERRSPAVLKVFALPFLLTLTAASYWLITGNFVLPAVGLVALLWLAAWLVFTYRNDPAKKPIADAAMDCCGDNGAPGHGSHAKDGHK